MQKIIEVTDLKKYYQSVKAVDGISFYVEEGSLFAFLGPNGAGKSTTIDVICTLLSPDGGQVRINGYTLGCDDAAIRSQIGVVFQTGLLDDLMTVKENLYTRGTFYGLKGEALKQAVERAAKCARVEEFINRPYGKLSGGQRRRADIARALVNTPRVLFLDEPTTGLDPQTRRSVWETIRNLQSGQGMTVFLTTHYMEEAAGADYIAVIDHGKITAKGTPNELKEQYSTDRLIIEPSDAALLEKAVKAAGLQYSVKGSEYIVPLAKTTDAIPLVSAWEQFISGFEVARGSMDDAFIEIISEGVELS